MTRPLSAEGTAIRSIVCPTCGAGFWEPCYSRSGREAKRYHLERKLWAPEAVPTTNDQVNSQTCPRCAAGPGARCRTADGFPAASAHKARKDIAP